MAVRVRLRRSNTAGAVPASLEDGELGINTADGKLYYGRPGGTVAQFGAGGLGDMLKSTYDPDGDGIVDNAEALGGYARDRFLVLNEGGVVSALTLFSANLDAATYPALNTGPYAAVGWNRSGGDGEINLIAGAVGGGASHLRVYRVGPDGVPSLKLRLTDMDLYVGTAQNQVWHAGNTHATSHAVGGSDPLALSVLDQGTGTAGHVWTKTANGAAWQAPPSGGGGVASTGGTATDLTLVGITALNSTPLYLRARTDANHQLVWKATWGGISIDGPMFIGYGGGGVGTTNLGQGEKTILRWDNATAYLNEVEIAVKNDARFIDARTPTAHATSHVSGADQIPAATISASGLMTAADRAWLTKQSLKSALVAAVTGGSNSTTDVVLTSLTIPANTLAVGDQLRVSAAGTTNNGTTATNVSFWVRVGGTKITLATHAMGTTAATGTSWTLDAAIVARTVGASGTLSATGLSVWKTAALPSGAAQSTAKSTAASLLIEVGATMSVANASNGITAQQASIAFA